VAPPDRKVTVEVEIDEEDGNPHLFYRHNGGVTFPRLSGHFEKDECPGGNHPSASRETSTEV
jgi:hypothetical protein